MLGPTMSDSKNSSADTTSLALRKLSNGNKKSAAASKQHKRNASGAQKNRPPTFVSKLWSMINDPSNNEYIHWMDDGKSFQVTGREQFEAKILPKYFKHKNFSSFVRQLNMYGWHKVQDISSGTMNNTEEKWQFQSPNFIRGREDLLDNIQRNKSAKESDDEDELDIGRVLQELGHIRKNQIAIGEDLQRIKEDNQLLWTEHIQSQEKYHKQGETLDRIVRFLASLYGNQPKLLQDITNPNGSIRNQLMIMPPKDVSDSISDAYSSSSLNAAGSGVDSNPGLSSGLTGFDGYDTTNGRDNGFGMGNPTSNRITSLSSTGTTPRNVTSPSIEEIPDSGVPISANDLQLSLPKRPSRILEESSSNDARLSTPSSLFPELTSFADNSDIGKELSPVGKSAGNGPSIADRLADDSQSIDNLTRSIESQELSLQQVQDWIQKMAPNYEDPVAKDGDGDSMFDVNEFLVDPSPGAEVANENSTPDLSTSASTESTNSGAATGGEDDEIISPSATKKRRLEH